MSLTFLARLIRVIAEIFIWIVIASALLSYFLSPYHPVRQFLDRILEPFLNPIRRVIPAAGMFDFSPLVLTLAVWIVSQILIQIILSLA